MEELRRFQVEMPACSAIWESYNENEEGPTSRLKQTEESGTEPTKLQQPPQPSTEKDAFKESPPTH